MGNRICELFFSSTLSPDVFSVGSISLGFLFSMRENPFLVRVELATNVETAFASANKCGDIQLLEISNDQALGAKVLDPFVFTRAFSEKNKKPKTKKKKNVICELICSNNLYFSLN